MTSCNWPGGSCQYFESLLKKMTEKCPPWASPTTERIHPMSKPKKELVTCEHCSPLRKEFPIRSPDDLTEAIRQAQKYVANGLLIEIPLVVKGRSPFPLIMET